MTTYSPAFPRFVSFRFPGVSLVRNLGRPATRLAIGAVVVWSVWTAGRGLIQLSGLHPSAQGSVVARLGGNLQGAMGLERDGILSEETWAFPGCRLGILARNCSQKELTSVLADFSDCPVVLDRDVDADLEAGASLIELVQLWGADRRGHAGIAVYSVDQPRLKVRVTVRVPSAADEAEQFLAGVVAQPASGGQWHVWGLMPGIRDSEGPGNDHLLPLPAESSRICARRTVSGDVGMEMVDVRASSEELLSQWTHAGWTVRPWNSSVPGTFAFRCENGTQIVSAWSEDAPGELRRVVLMRQPKDS